MSTPTKPLVVMGGWLGCQPRFLTRYAALYERLGMNTVQVIAPPMAVVETTYQPGFTLLSPSEVDNNKATGMEKIVGDVLCEIEKNKADSILFHVFSNGGCFVWEHVRRAVDNAQNLHDPLATLKSKIKGIVFDSCPAWFGEDTSGLASALQHCSDTDMQEILESFGSIVLSSDDGPEHRDRRKRRNQEYFSYLRDDQLDIPQLYLYCMNDPLSDYKKIDDLVAWRRQTFRGPILRKQWTDSAHCAHLVKHQNEYTRQIADFTTFVLRNHKL